MITYLVIGAVAIVVVLLCICLAVANFSFDNYRESLKKLSQMRNSYGITTLDYVSEINRMSFKGMLRVSKAEEYKDHYGAGTIALSDNTTHSNSLASLAIVSHELGHARQDFEGDKLKRHWKLRRTGRAIGVFFVPTSLTGIVLALLSLFKVLNEMYLYFGIGAVGVSFLIFVVALIVKYKEISIEKEASDFALDFLRIFLVEPEIEECRRFLDSARLTYWASLFRTMFGWTLLTRKEKLFK